MFIEHLLRAAQNAPKGCVVVRTARVGLQCRSQKRSPGVAPRAEAVVGRSLSPGKWAQWPVRPEPVWLSAPPHRPHSACY